MKAKLTEEEMEGLKSCIQAADLFWKDATDGTVAVDDLQKASQAFKKLGGEQIELRDREPWPYESNG